MSPASSIDTRSSEEKYYRSPGSPSTALSSSPSVSSNPANHGSQQQQQQQTAVVNTLDDIFGSTPPSSVPDYSVQTPSHQASLHVEPSDLPALRRRHVTEGYRDGVTEAKGEHMQRGFDRGYPVGAELGMRVGIILGVLEGVVKATPAPSRGNASGAGDNAEDNAGLPPEMVEEVKALYGKAVEELAVENIFTGAADTLEREKNKEGSEPCLILGEAADKVVEKWEVTVQQLLAELS